MLVVGIDGSGRGGANTGALVKAILHGARDRGATTELFELGPMNVLGCCACMECAETATCTREDGLRRFYDLAPEAEVLVLGTPIYFEHVSSQMKAFIDRMYCFLGAQLKSRYPNPSARVVLVLTHGAPESVDYSAVGEWLKSRLKAFFDLDTVTTLTVPRCSTPPLDAASAHVFRARQLGRDLL